MLNHSVFTDILFHIAPCCSDSFPLTYAAWLANALLFFCWGGIAKDSIGARHAANNLSRHDCKLLHLRECDNLCTCRLIESLPIVHYADTTADIVLNGADVGWSLVLAGFPHPHELCIVPTAAVLVHRQLTACAQSRAVLATTRVGLRPGCTVQAATHAVGRAAADTEARIEWPSQLLAGLF